MEKLVTELNITSLTIISPCFNESESLLECATRTKAAVDKFGELDFFEHIFIDNNSKDDSLEILKKIKVDFPHIRILTNSENIGVFRSIRRAIFESQGDQIIPFLASDNQDPPELITQMLREMTTGKFDSVFGVRKTRIEAKHLLLMRRIFYRLLKWGLGGNYQPGASEYCLISRDTAIKVASIEDQNPFLRIYLSKLQGRVKFLDYQMVERKAGKSSANIFTLTDDALNAFSIVMPSIFSRILVISAGFSAVAAGSGIIGFILNLFFHKLSLATIAIVGLLSSIFFVLVSYLSLIGHYIFILHSEVRNSTFGDTSEIN